jgi:hypothetical protein
MSVFSFNDFDDLEGDYYAGENSTGGVSDEVFPTSPPTPPVSSVKGEQHGERKRKGKTASGAKTSDFEPDIGAIFKAAKGMHVEEILQTFMQAMNTGNEDGYEGDDVEEEFHRVAVMLRNLGLVLKMSFLLLMSFLKWLIVKTEKWIPTLHLVFKEVHRRKTAEIKDGLWDGMFNTPDQWLESHLPTWVYESSDYFFLCLYWCMTHNRLTLPILTFLIGYYLG